MTATDPAGGLRIVVSRADVARYADASGDANPIHLDEDHARATGLPGVVAHGMLTLGRVVSAVAEAERALVTDCETRFSAPVVLDGGPVAVDVRVAVIEALGPGRTRVEITATAGGTAVLTRARATLVALGG